MTEGLRLEVVDRVATVTLDRPAKKNPLTFELYAALRDWFRAVGDEPRHPGDRADRRRRQLLLRAATCTRSSARWSAARCRELLEFTRMTGALVDGMRTCPQPIVAAVDGVCAGAGAILAMASDIRLGDARREDGVPVHARRAGRLRHGRVRDPAAHHRPRSRRRAAPDRALDGRRGGRAVRLLQPARGPREPARRGAVGGLVAGARADVRARDDQDGCCSRSGRWAWARRSRQRRRRRPSACRPTTSSGRTTHSRHARSRSSRATDMADRSFLTWPFFEDRHRALKDELDAFGAGLGELAHADDDVDATCRALVRAPGRVRASLRLSAELDVRSLCLARETLAYYGGLPDFAFAMQGLGSGAGLAVRHGRAESRAPAARRRRRGHHRRSRCPSRRPAPTSRRSRPPRDSTATPTCSTVSRPGSRTAASPTPTPSSRAPARQRGRAGSRPSSSMPTRRACASRSAST